MRFVLVIFFLQFLSCATRYNAKNIGMYETLEVYLNLSKKYELEQAYSLIDEDDKKKIETHEHFAGGMISSHYGEIHERSFAKVLNKIVSSRCQYQIIKKEKSIDKSKEYFVEYLTSCPSNDSVIFGEAKILMEIFKDYPDQRDEVDTKLTKVLKENLKNKMYKSEYIEFQKKVNRVAMKFKNGKWSIRTQIVQLSLKEFTKWIKGYVKWIRGYLQKGKLSAQDAHDEMLNLAEIQYDLIVSYPGDKKLKTVAHIDKLLTELKVFLKQQMK